MAINKFSPLVVYFKPAHCQWHLSRLARLYAGEFFSNLSLKDLHYQREVGICLSRALKVKLLSVKYGKIVGFKQWDEFCLSFWFTWKSFYPKNVGWNINNNLIPNTYFISSLLEECDLGDWLIQTFKLFYHNIVWLWVKGYSYYFCGEIIYTLGFVKKKTVQSFNILDNYIYIYI